MKAYNLVSAVLTYLMIDILTDLLGFAEDIRFTAIIFPQPLNFASVRLMCPERIEQDTGDVLGCYGLFAGIDFDTTVTQSYSPSSILIILP